MSENPLLAGIRVLDLSRLLPGPFCTLYLAQLGAEVIKIEEPDGGDYARSMPELFEQLNRGKKSIALDLREPADVAAFKQLVKGAEVVIESFRPGVMDKLGCGYEELRRINPKLVFASLTGYGHTGPYADRAGHDMNYCAYAGVLDQIGAWGRPPVLSNVQIADLAGGALTCAIGILSAVIGARASGHGCFVDVAMLDGAMALQPLAMTALRKYGAALPRGGDTLTGLLPNYRVYKCRDGKYFAIGALEPKFFLKLLRVLGERGPLPARLLGRLANSKRSARQPRVAKASSAQPTQIGKFAQLLDDPAKLRWLSRPAHWALATVFRLRTRDQWEQLLADQDACACGVLSLGEAWTTSRSGLVA